MYVLALSDDKQHAAAAGYKPAPQLGRQIAAYKKAPQSLAGLLLCIERRYASWDVRKFYLTITFLPFLM